MKTKEEIASKYTAIRFKTGNNPEGGMSDHEYFHIMQDDISAFAREQSIAFAEWMSKENYQKHANGFYSNEPPVAGKKTWFTLSELFDLFIKTVEK